MTYTNLGIMYQNLKNFTKIIVNTTLKILNLKIKNKFGLFLDGKRYR